MPYRAMPEGLPSTLASKPAPALALCTGTLHWHFALALCTGTLYWQSAFVGERGKWRGPADSITGSSQGGTADFSVFTFHPPTEDSDVIAHQNSPHLQSLSTVSIPTRTRFYLYRSLCTFVPSYLLCPPEPTDITAIRMPASLSGL